MQKPVSHKVASFPPQVGADCRVLVLGTVPSLRSLELRQSYGHAQNLFWTFMGEMFDAGRELPYAAARPAPVIRAADNLMKMKNSIPDPRRVESPSTKGDHHGSYARRSTPRSVEQGQAGRPEGSL